MEIENLIEINLISKQTKKQEKNYNFLYQDKTIQELEDFLKINYSNYIFKYNNQEKEIKFKNKNIKIEKIFENLFKIKKIENCEIVIEIDTCPDLIEDFNI